MLFKYFKTLSFSFNLLSIELIILSTLILDSSEDHNTKSQEDQGSDQAYRLVPIDKSRASEYESINFIELLRYYWDKRRIFYWCIAIFLAIGLFFAFFSPVEYRTSASIIPEYELQDKVNEVIESYGLLFGLTGSIRENRTPSYLLELYPYMINSLAFQRSLIRRPFNYEKTDTAITLYHYFTKIRQPSFMNTVHKYTFGLPGTLASTQEAEDKVQPLSSLPAADSSNQLSTQGDSLFSIVTMKPTEKRVINQIRNRISANYNRRTGIVDIQTKMPEPELAAILVQLTLDVLREKVATYKTGKSQVYKQFLETEQARAKDNLDKARQELIEFNSSESQPLNKRMELQSNYEVSLDQYNVITQQLSRIKLEIKEQLPVFRILDDITIPNQKSEPNRKVILTISVLLGFLSAICWITITFFASTLKGKSPH